MFHILYWCYTVIRISMSLQTKPVLFFYFFVPPLLSFFVSFFLTFISFACILAALFLPRLINMLNLHFAWGRGQSQHALGEQDPGMVASSSLCNFTFSWYKSRLGGFLRQTKYHIAIICSCFWPLKKPFWLLKMKLCSFTAPCKRLLSGKSSATKEFFPSQIPSPKHCSQLDSNLKFNWSMKYGPAHKVCFLGRMGFTTQVQLLGLMSIRVLY